MRVRTEDLAPVLQAYCDRVLEGRTLIQKRSKVGQRPLSAIMMCKEEWLDLRTADQLLIAIDRPEALGLEVPIYDNV